MLTSAFRLDQNYPNPFNPTTTLRFHLAEAAPVRLEVFDVTGTRIATLVQATLGAGAHEVQWNARNEAGAPVASGLYLYRLRQGAQVATGRMTLLQ